MPVTPIAIPSEVVTECNGTGTGPYSVFDVAGVTSGAINDKIREANVTLQGFIGDAASGTNTLLNEQVKRFEVNYAAAKLAASLVGVVITDGFNVGLGGLEIQRMGAKFQTYVEFIKEHLNTSKWYLIFLQEHFYVYNSEFPTGYNERGTPINYWSTSNARYG